MMQLGEMSRSKTRRETEIFAEHRAIDRSKHWRYSGGQRKGVLKNLSSTAAPWMMKGLSIAGTAAMFLVGGGILVHGIPPVDHWIESIAQSMATWPGVGGLLNALTPLLMDAAIGIRTGALVLAGIRGIQWARHRATVQT